MAESIGATAERRANRRTKLPHTGATVEAELPVGQGDELEITEAVLLRDSEATLAALRRIKSLGVRISMDDFGTGYSSLTYLKRLPARVLKIDQSFVRDMLDDPDDLAIVKGVVGLAAAMLWIDWQLSLVALVLLLALLRIVNHYRKLVGKQTIASAQDKVANF